MSNPLMRTMLRERRGDQLDVGRNPIEQGARLTRGKVASSSLIALGIVAVFAVGTYILGMSNPGLASLLNIIGVGGIFATALLSALMRKWRNGSFIATALLSMFEGLMAGGFTFTVGNYMVTGVPVSSIITQALIGTAALFSVALFLYSSGMIRVTSKFRSFMFIAVSGMAVAYGINLLITLFTGNNLLLAEGPIPIIIGLVAIVLGTLSLVTSFDDADAMIASAAPERTKWAMASAIMVDVVWLYMEIFRVIALINRS